MKRAIILALLIGALAAASTEVYARQPTSKRQRVPNKVHRKDPPPLETQRYLDITVRIRRTKLEILGVRQGRFARRRLLPRFRGRYQVRLYSQRLLRDLVRFSFPLTLPAGERTSPNIALDRALARGVEATTVVRVPFQAGIDRALLLDRKLGHRLPINLAKLLPAPYRPKLPAPSRTGIFKHGKK